METPTEITENETNRPPALERAYALASRCVVWGLFFCTLYVLRSFFLLIFLTFVFSYIQSHGVERLEPYLKSRTLSVISVGITFLCTLVLIGWFLIPQVIDQAKLFADKHTTYLDALDRKVLDLSEHYPVLENVITDLDLSQDNEGVEEPSGTRERSLSLTVLQRLAGLGDEGNPDDNLHHLVGLLRNIGQPLLAIGSAFFLSLMFSFLIILDLPRLTHSIDLLGQSRVAFVYEEVAGSIKTFATVLGRAFQAQLIIALVNTVLTAGVIYLLGLQKSVAFLSLIVFFCSFIPVAGVFISSVPICLMTLQQSGFHMVFLAIGLIWVVHLIEAYVLNPRIFGDKLKINPVIVLIILTVAGKLFGVWGLILSLPIYTYIFSYAIQIPTDDQEALV